MVVQTYVHAGYSSEVILTTVFNSIMKVKGVTKLRRLNSITEVLQRLDADYKASGNLDTQIREFYQMLQQSRESVKNFTTRVSDAVSLIDEAHPSHFILEEADSISQDHFFRGLKPELEQSLTFLQEALGHGKCCVLPGLWAHGNLPEARQEVYA